MTVAPADCMASAATLWSLACCTNQPHKMATTSINSRSERTLNWNRHRKSKLVTRQTKPSIVANPTIPTANRAGETFFSPRRDQPNCSETRSNPTTATNTTVARSGVSLYQRRLGTSTMRRPSVLRFRFKVSGVVVFMDVGEISRGKKTCQEPLFCPPFPPPLTPPASDARRRSLPWGHSTPASPCPGPSGWKVS